MSQNDKIVYMDAEYSIHGLEIAISKAVDVVVEPNEGWDDIHFDQDKLPDSWKTNYSKAVVTKRNGKMVFVFKPDGIDISKPFKAKLITKYLLNNSRYDKYSNVEINLDPVVAYKNDRNRSFTKHHGKEIPVRYSNRSYMR